MPRVRVLRAHINLGSGTRQFGDIEDIGPEAVDYLVSSGAVELVRGAGADTPERAASPELARPGGASRVQRRG